MKNYYYFFLLILETHKNKPPRTTSIRVNIVFIRKLNKQGIKSKENQEK